MLEFNDLYRAEGMKSVVEFSIIMKQNNLYHAETLENCHRNNLARDERFCEAVENNRTKSSVSCPNISRLHWKCFAV